MDILHQNRQAAGIVFINAEKCYDRIAHNMASLMLQHVGIPKDPVLLMFSTLQHLVHRVLMAHGISEDEYGGIWQEMANKLPLMGIIQGNGAGPTTPSEF
jgi:hypothetical protein